jgi:hypothetical protein
MAGPAFGASDRLHMCPATAFEWATACPEYCMVSIPGCEHILQQCCCYTASPRCSAAHAAHLHLDTYFSKQCHSCTKRPFCMHSMQNGQRKDLHQNHPYINAAGPVELKTGKEMAIAPGCFDNCTLCIPCQAAKPVLAHHCRWGSPVAVLAEHTVAPPQLMSCRLRCLYTETKHGKYRS